eukprot:PhM_4_TR9491/c8_g1_i1/m.26003
MQPQPQPYYGQQHEMQPQYGMPPAAVAPGYPNNNNNTMPTPAAATMSTTHKAALSQAVAPGDWDKGLFDCDDDCRVMYTSCFCFPCNVIYHRGALASKEAKLCACRTICCPCDYFRIRGKIRKEYNIEGEDMVDCCTMIFCPMCAASQHHRQLRFKGRTPKGAIGPFGLDPATGRPLRATDTQKCFYVITILVILAVIGGVVGAVVATSSSSSDDNAATPTPTPTSTPIPTTNVTAATLQAVVTTILRRRFQ